MNAQSKVEAVTGLNLLRQPFPGHQISKLPKETGAQAKQRKADQDSGKWPPKCDVCSGYHHTKAVHLDYVGHAALTDRLLDADPQWAWEPLGFTPEGLPAFDRTGGLWIKLTICGVSRFGYGAADGKSGGDAVKEIIGDALRNAAMRFGAALDLWHKGDLHAEEDEPKAPHEAKVVPFAQEAPVKPRQVLDGPHTSPSTLKGAVKAIVHALEGFSDVDEFEAYMATEDVIATVEQCERDMPDWYHGGPSVPGEFVPLNIRIADKRRELEEIETLRVRNPIAAG